MRNFFLAISLLFIACPAVFAFQLGPATPSADHGEVTFGAGYFLRNAEWNHIVETEQNLLYLHLGYGMGIEDEPRWEAYLRLGSSDMKGGGIDAGHEPAFAAGVKGTFHEGRIFAWGLVAQGSYFFEWEGNGVEIEDAWEAEAGFPVQARLGSALVYAGPAFYLSKAKAISAFGETDLEEDGMLGGFGGFRVDYGPFGFEVELQYKSDLSGGGQLIYRF